MMLVTSVTFANQRCCCSSVGDLHLEDRSAGEVDSEVEAPYDHQADQQDDEPQGDHRTDRSLLHEIDVRIRADELHQSLRSWGL